MKSQSKVWSTPQLTVHGGVTQITKNTKMPCGSQDAFGTVGVS
jgi:hypothetical protein